MLAFDYGLDAEIRAFIDELGKTFVPFCGDGLYECELQTLSSHGTGFMCGNSTGKRGNVIWGFR